jgi:Na+-translocating ferredoxin:NAD+ oxidoreductase subunit G
MSDLVQIEGAPRPKTDPREIVRIAINLVMVCALGAVVLGGIFMGTERISRAARLAGERRAVSGLLALPEGARVLEVRQFLAPERREVVYRAVEYGDEKSLPREIVFAMDGTVRSNGPAPSAAPGAGLAPLGRTFVAYVNGALAGFVVEGESRGYKNRIRFFVALDSAFVVQGVKVVEHEEDPGLGAEVATGWFQAQFAGRTADQVATLDVTKDPMPEDWRAALLTLAGEGPTAWRAKHADLLAREHARPVYAVTGATISSRALTRGVRTTVEHFRRRWALLAPQLGGTS